MDEWMSERVCVCVLEKEREKEKEWEAKRKFIATTNDPAKEIKNVTGEKFERRLIKRTQQLLNI